LLSLYFGGLKDDKKKEIQRKNYLEKCDKIIVGSIYGSPNKPAFFEDGEKFSYIYVITNKGFDADGKLHYQYVFLKEDLTPYSEYTKQMVHEDIFTEISKLNNHKFLGLLVDKLNFV
jgi:hypothetical protein